MTEPLAKCPGIVREKSLGTANMETPVNYAVNFWQFGCKITASPEFWTWLSPFTLAPHLVTRRRSVD
jgi:hypothetical protein